MLNTSKILIYLLTFPGVLLILTSSCSKKEDVNPLETGSVSDIEGNVYKTVKIGTQWWMAENLKTTRYRNGNPIPMIANDTVWGSLTTGAYCNMNNDINYSATYGKLYNWFTVKDSRNIAPDGWHVPTMDEWTLLVDYLGGEIIAGGKLKEEGTTHWSDPNLYATNETGFTAVPGGCRYFGTFVDFSYFGEYWISDDVNPVAAMSRRFSFVRGDCVTISCTKKDGLSVRCVKDN